MTSRKTTVLRFKIDDLQQMKWEFPKAANRLYNALRDLYKLIVVKRQALEEIIAETPETAPQALEELISTKNRSALELLKNLPKSDSNQ